MRSTTAVQHHWRAKTFLKAFSVVSGRNVLMIPKPVISISAWNRINADCIGPRSRTGETYNTDESLENDVGCLE